jgi:hypothetical protein
VTEDHVKEFLTATEMLVGKRCWGIVAGANTGSVLDLHLGQKLLRQHQVRNPTLPEDLRQNRGELSLFIQCAWRLEDKERVICGWGEDFSHGGPLGKGIQLIVDQPIERVSIRRPSFDLTLYFANSLMLQVFCDQTELSEEHGMNYALLAPGYSYTVATRSQLVREGRTLK